MAKRGRKPKAPVLSGDMAGAPTKPATVASDAEASELWDYLVDLLESQRVLSPTDGPVLTALCSAYSRLVRVRALLAVDTLVVHNDKNGATKAHPLLQVEAGAASEVHRYAAELGLSPTARARIEKVAEPEDDDGWEDDG